MVQETALDLHPGLAGFDGQRREEFIRWIRRVLLNNVANSCRQYEQTDKRNVRREVSWDLADLAAQELRDGAQTPGASQVSEEQLDLLNRCLGRLPDHLQRVIELRHREHLSFREIGHQMERSPEAARKLWARAIERLQQEIQGSDEH